VGRHQYGIKLEDRYRDRESAVRLEDRLAAYEAEIMSWREYNRALFNALRIEKTVMTVLLALIFVVVGVNVFHGLRRTVFERSEEIGVLRSLGAGSRSVQAVFVLDGLLIGLTGGLAGLLLGLLTAQNVNAVFRGAEWVLNATVNMLDSLVGNGGSLGGRLQLFSSAYFYVSEVPTKVFAGELLLIFAFAVGASVVSAYLGSRRAATIRPAEVLRYE
jgi:lipoprotein-releasing system permease protein